MLNGIILNKYGNKTWYKNGLIHREGGPAIEHSNGYKAWYYEDNRHSPDGPAIEYRNGDKLWFYHGQLIECSFNEEFLRLIKLKAFW